MKDRRHYGRMVLETIMEVTPEQAYEWLHTRPPLPRMWTPDIPADDTTQAYLADMLAGKWDNDRPVEPIMINKDSNFILGGHHRLFAVTLTGEPQMLRIRFYSKPKGWDAKLQEMYAAEVVPDTRPACPICTWRGGDIDEHVKRSHREGRF